MTFAMGGAPAPSSDRIPVELFQILKDHAVESAALNMQYAICTQYAICRLPAEGGTWRRRQRLEGCGPDPGAPGAPEAGTRRKASSSPRALGMSQPC